MRACRTLDIPIDCRASTMPTDPMVAKLAAIVAHIIAAQGDISLAGYDILDHMEPGPNKARCVERLTRAQDRLTAAFKAAHELERGAQLAERDNA